MLCNILSKASRSVDIFKTPIQVTYKSKPSYTTHFGAAVSFLVIILIILLAVYFSSNLTKRLNPYVVYQEETISHFPRVPITVQNYTMAIKIIDDNMEVWTKEKMDSIIDFRPLYIHFTNQTYDVIDVPIKLCEEVYPDISNLTINSEQFIGAMCPYNFSYPIYGNTETEDFGLLTNLIYPCSNSTHNPEKVCKTTEEIKKAMRNTQIKILYIDNILYATDYARPLHKITSVYWDFLDFQVFKNIEFYFKSVTIDTDSGILLQSIETQYGAIFDPKLYVKNLIRGTNEQLPLFQIDIKSINQRVYCKRIYEKIQNVLANMGGIIKALMTVGLIVIVLVNNTILKFDMVNSFYDYTQIYESDSKKIVELRKMARSGVRYSVLKKNDGKNTKKGGKNDKNDKNSKPSISVSNLTNQPQAGNLNVEKQIEMMKVNNIGNSNLINNLNADSNIQNKIEDQEASNIDGQNQEREDKSYIIEKEDKSNLEDKIGESVNLGKSSLNQYSDISMIQQPSSIDISLGVSKIDSNRMLNPPELDNKLAKEPSPSSKIDSPQETLSLSEEYLLRKDKHSVLSELTYNTREIVRLTFPFCKFDAKLKKKSEILTKSYEIIMMVLDVSSLMRMTHDINLIKGLFLNEDQILLSKYIKRIMFTEDMLKPDLESELLKIKDYYLKSKEHDLNDVDKKLFQYLDDDLIFVMKN